MLVRVERTSPVNPACALCLNPTDRQSCLHEPRRIGSSFGTRGKRGLGRLEARDPKHQHVTRQGITNGGAFRDAESLVVCPVNICQFLATSCQGIRMSRLMRTVERLQPRTWIRNKADEGFTAAGFETLVWMMADGVGEP